MEKRVELPETASRWYLPQTLDSLRASAGAPRRLILDWGPNGFTGPAGLVAIAAYAITAQDEGAELAFNNWDRASYPARVRLKPVCGFDDDYVMPRSDPTRRFTNVTRVRGPRQARNFARDAAEILRVPDDLAGLARHSMREILYNVHDHSFSDCQAIAACQFYEERDEVVYAVADTGRGIPAVVSHLEDVNSADEAIDIALRPGFSTRKDGGNLGLGLPVSAKIATAAGGALRIVSDDAMVTVDSDSQDSRAVTAWPGTLIVGTIPRCEGISIRDVVEEVEGSI